MKQDTKPLGTGGPKRFFPATFLALSISLLWIGRRQVAMSLVDSLRDATQRVEESCTALKLQKEKTKILDCVAQYDKLQALVAAMADSTPSSDGSKTTPLAATIVELAERLPSIRSGLLQRLEATLASEGHLTARQALRAADALRTQLKENP